MFRRSMSRRVVLAVAVLALSAAMVLPTEVEATVEEQRARLPPPAACPDPVEGVWLAHSYAAYQSTWYIFQLTVRRETPESTVLGGEIKSHFWDGGPKDVQPPPCRSNSHEQIVNMPAKGDFTDGKVRFGGTSWKAEPPICGHNTGRYYPDNFTGVIDPKTQEFQSVNNDGGPAVNEPTVFRRIKCLDTTPQNNKTPVKPPPFEPPKRLGCGRS
jgi:hypothetical protein